MAFRGWITLNGIELANSSRTVSHLGGAVPELDDLVFSTPSAGSCGLVESVDHPGFFELPDPVEVRPGLYAPPPGARMYGRAMFEVDENCWSDAPLCGTTDCMSALGYDDSWPGLIDWLAADAEYRVELAPWFSTRIPESGEFAGLWIMDVKGLGPTPVERTVTAATGDGGVAGAHRDVARELEFDALLIGCTNAGLEYGLEWLSCQLRSTKDRVDSVMRFLNAHPASTAATPDELLRETRGVVYTGAPEITEAFNPRAKSHEQATIYRVTWRMTVLSPHVYLPSVRVPVTWDSAVTKRVNWLHAADCEQPYTCLDMPVMFSTDCAPEEIEVVSSAPPSCGGCMPVCAMRQHSFIVPSRNHPTRCRETAVGVNITNRGSTSLTLQAFWRVCGSDVRCENSLWPLQVSGLPPATSLVLDSVSGRFWTVYDDRRWRPVGMVGTPTGAPWRPIVVDRAQCWELVVLSPVDADFDVELTLSDREP